MNYTSRNIGMRTILVKHSLYAIVTLFIAGRSSADINHVRNVVKLDTEEEKLSYIRALDDDATWKMASQAAEEGWSDHSIAVAIIETHFAQRWKDASPMAMAQEMLPVVTNRTLHPRLRASVAATALGYARRSEALWSFAVVKAALSLLEDPEVDYDAKQKLPGRLLFWIQHRSKAGAIMGRNSIAQSQEKERIISVATRVVDYLSQYIKSVPNKGEDPRSSIAYACDDLSRYVAWLGQIASQNSKTQDQESEEDKALGVARRVLADVLTGKEYAKDVAYVVLRRATDAHLGHVLTERSLKAMRDDPRFSSSEQQNLIQNIIQDQKGVGGKSL